MLWLKSVVLAVQPSKPCVPASGCFQKGATFGHATRTAGLVAVALQVSLSHFFMPV